MERVPERNLDPPDFDDEPEPTNDECADAAMDADYYDHLEELWCARLDDLIDQWKEGF